MHSCVKAFISRSPKEFWLLGEAMVAVMIARAGMWVFPLAKVRRLVRRVLSADQVLPLAARGSEDQVIRAVISAGKHSPLGSTCLATGLVGQAMLQRHGHSANLRLGVRRDERGKFTAHAWLEREGNVIVGGPGTFVSTYTRLPEMERLIQ